MSGHVRTVRMQNHLGYAQPCFGAVGTWLLARSRKHHPAQRYIAMVSSIIGATMV